MLIKSKIVRLPIIFLLVIILPLVQKQWLNLYLFNINNFTIYQVLYYLSGLIVPILVIINSLNNITYYKFPKNTNNISGKLLLLITLFVSTTLSFLITNYIFINLKIFFNLLFINNEYLAKFDISSQIIFIVIISIFLIFNKTKILIKKVVLTNFFIFSIITWYAHINNTILMDEVPFYIFKSENIYFINITFLLAIETVFYLWSYISYSSNLSDWKVPKLHKVELLPIFNIIMFYFSIILYYSILYK